MHTRTATTRRWAPYGVLLGAYAALVTLFFLRHRLFGDWFFGDADLRAAMETVGALAAIIVAVLLLQKDSTTEVDDAPAAIGFARARCETVPLVEEALELMRPLAAERDGRLEWRPVGPLPALDCDRDRVLEVFSNLIGNAVKYTPRHGVITVSAEPRDGQVRFAVQDTGPGIAEDALPHLFERYWQVTRARRAGIGLGLFIVKGIVEAHGGTVSVESRLGAGSTFTFTLPAVT